MLRFQVTDLLTPSPSELMFKLIFNQSNQKDLKRKRWNLQVGLESATVLTTAPLALSHQPEQMLLIAPVSNCNSSPLLLPWERTTVQADWAVSMAVLFQFSTEWTSKKVKWFLLSVDSTVIRFINRTDFKPKTCGFLASPCADRTNLAVTAERSKTTVKEL